MTKKEEIHKIPELPEEIIEAGKNGQLVMFVGAGASMMQNLPSWNQLATKVLYSMQAKGYITFADIEQLRSLDARKQLSISKSIADSNGDRVDLSTHLTGGSPNKGIYKIINNIGCVCVTTNYDSLLAPCIDGTDDFDGSTAARSVRRVYRRDELLANVLDEPGTVIHLHGSIEDEDSLIFTTEHYLRHYDSESVQHFLGSLFERKTVLFLGYGLEEAEILEHILRRGMARVGKEKTRFSIQAFYKSQEPLYLQLREYYENTFGVHLIGFNRDYQDYNQLEIVMRKWAEKIQIREPSLVEDLNVMKSVLNK
ncbi:MAG: SIR2 family protein [Verrucomicrobiota bacterium]